MLAYYGWFTTDINTNTLPSPSHRHWRLIRPPRYITHIVVTLVCHGTLRYVTYAYHDALSYHVYYVDEYIMSRAEWRSQYGAMAMIAVLPRDEPLYDWSLAKFTLRHLVVTPWRYYVVTTGTTLYGAAP